MQTWCLMYGLRPREWFRLMGKLLAYGVSAALLVVLSGWCRRWPRVVRWCWSGMGGRFRWCPMLPNILRITMSIDRAAATGDPGYGFVRKAFSGGMDARARLRGVRCVPIRPDGSARGSGKFAERQAAAADAARCAESRAARTLLWRRWWRERSKRRRPWSAQRCAAGNNGGGKTLLHMRTWAMAPERAEVARADAGAKGLPGCGHIRLTGGRALLRIGAAAERLDGPAGSRDSLLA